MTDATAVQPNAPLGVGSLLGESFSILFGNFIKVFIVAFVPTLLGVLISALFNGLDVAVGLAEPNFAEPGAGIAFALAMIANIAVYSLTTALLIQLAYDAKLNRPIHIGRYIGPAISVIVPLAILSIVVGILFGIGFVFLIVPGLWIYAVFSATAPAIVIERAGFGGMGRSISLTKGYRWPIVGAILVAFICLMIINMIAAFLVGIIGSTAGVIVAALILTAVSTIGAGLISILVSLIYARLREIKEGVSVDQIASVFD